MVTGGGYGPPEGLDKVQKVEADALLGQDLGQALHAGPDEEDADRERLALRQLVERLDLGEQVRCHRERLQEPGALRRQEAKVCQQQARELAPKR